VCSDAPRAISACEAAAHIWFFAVSSKVLKFISLEGTAFVSTSGFFFFWRESSMTNLIKQPFVVLLVGASGDWAKKEIWPSLYRNFYNNEFAPGTIFVGLSRKITMPDGARFHYRRGTTCFPLWQTANQRCHINPR
jgi:hypothetical protein